MAQFGSAPLSWSGWESYEDDNAQVGQTFTAPETGTINELWAFLGREGGAGGCTLIVWQGDTIIGSGSATAAGSGGSGPGEQSWCASTGLSIPITGGVAYTLGWRRGTDTFWDWSWASGGSFMMGNVGSWGGATEVGGSIGAYAVYTPGPTGHAVYIDGVQETDMQIDGAEVTDVYLNGVPI